MSIRFGITIYRISLRWPIHIILNPVDNTKLYCYTSHRRSTAVSFRNLPLYTKIKVLIINRDIPIIFSVLVLLRLKYNYCFRDKSKHCLGWEFGYFATSLFCRKTRQFSTVLLLITMFSGELYYRQIARFHWVCLSQRRWIIWVRFVKIWKTSNNE